MTDKQTPVKEELFYSCYNASANKLTAGIFVWYKKNKTFPDALLFYYRVVTKNCLLIVNLSECVRKD